MSLDAAALLRLCLHSIHLDNLLLYHHPDLHHAKCMLRDGRECFTFLHTKKFVLILMWIFFVFMGAHLSILFGTVAHNLGFCG